MIYKQYIQRFLTGLFWTVLVSLVLLLFVSWVLSIYVDGVQGLLTSRGIRWMCSNIVPNFATVHIAKILIGLMAISVLRDSGILHTFRGHLSLKQRRSLQITGISALILLLSFSLLILLPDAVLLSAFGTIKNSAFSKGFYGLLACLVFFIGNVYGYTSGRFTTMNDFVQAHVSMFSSVSRYFVLLFLSSQLIACLDFTGILPLLGDDGTTLFLLKGLLYNLSLLLYILLAL
ncbi:MAG: hypothetical protein GXY64_04965 [Bacteroidales bacterium]|nr:hypothetical protein [Bacteroidales bacterium]